MESCHSTPETMKGTQNTWETLTIFFYLHATDYERRFTQNIPGLAETNTVRNTAHFAGPCCADCFLLLPRGGFP